MCSGDDKDYAVNLVESIRKLDYLCDVTLVAGLDGQRFPVHRIIMVASSPYFEAMLGPSYEEANQNGIVLNHIDGVTLNTIINCCYNCPIKITSDNVDDIMAAASNMKLIQLERKCSGYWNAKLDAGNCVNIMLFADRYNAKDLWNKAIRCICEHFEEIPNVDMVTIDRRNFGEILQGETISAAKHYIFNCLLQWVQHDESNRSQFVGTLANSIRLEHMPIEFLTEIVEPFYEKHGCVNLVEDEYRIRGQDSATLGSQRFSNSIYCADMIVCGSIMLQQFDMDAKLFECMESIEFETPHLKYLIFSCGKIYVFGKSNDVRANGASRMVKMESYDMDILSTEVLPDLALNSLSGPPVGFGKYIYAFGKGYRDDEHFTRCSRFDTERKLWECQDSLPCRMSRLSAVEVNGLIYVAGRIGRTEDYSSNFWCHDPKMNVWIEKAHTNLDGHSCKLCKAQHNLFICNQNVGALKYDVALNRWTKLKFIGPNAAEHAKKNIDYELETTIVLGDATYGILKHGNGQLFVRMQINNDECKLIEVVADGYLKDFVFVSVDLLFVYPRPHNNIKNK